MAIKRKTKKKAAPRRKRAATGNGLKKFQTYLKTKTAAVRKRVKAAEVKLNAAKRAAASARKKAISGFKKKRK